MLKVRSGKIAKIGWWISADECPTSNGEHAPAISSYVTSPPGSEGYTVDFHMCGTRTVTIEATIKNNDVKKGELCELENNAFVVFNAFGFQVTGHIKAAAGTGTGRTADAEAVNGLTHTVTPVSPGVTNPSGPGIVYDYSYASTLTLKAVFTANFSTPPGPTNKLTASFYADGTLYGTGETDLEKIYVCHAVRVTDNNGWVAETLCDDTPMAATDRFTALSIALA